MTISIIASQLTKSLIKNKGVQVGIGLTVAGIGASLGLGAVNSSVKEISNPLGIPSEIIVIAIIAVVLLVMVKKR